jgi:hypothetical protein
MPQSLNLFPIFCIIHWTLIVICRKSVLNSLSSVAVFLFGLLLQKVLAYCTLTCLSVCPHKIRNCEETERLTKKVLEIKVVGYHDSNSGVPSAVT